MCRKIRYDEKCEKFCKIFRKLNKALAQASYGRPRVSSSSVGFDGGSALEDIGFGNKVGLNIY